MDEGSVLHYLQNFWKSKRKETKKWTARATGIISQQNTQSEDSALYDSKP